MKKSRHSETQIVWILKEVEAGRLVKELCREYGISEATDYNWEALAIEVGLNLPSQRVFRLYCGPECTSTTLAEWADEHGIVLDFIQPGKPTQNSYIERFNRTDRDEVPNKNVVHNLTQVRELTGNWIRQYNKERQHDSLGDLTPWEYG